MNLVVYAEITELKFGLMNPLVDGGEVEDLLGRNPNCMQFA